MFSNLIRDYLTILGWVFVLSLVFYPLELLAPAEKKQPLLKRLFNSAYVPVLLAVVIVLLQPLFNLIAGVLLFFSGGALLPRIIDANTGAFGHFLFALAFAVTWDVCQYWLHRLQHRIPWLWETHRFHHSETALNATTQTRHHFFQPLVAFIFYLPVLALIGGQTPHYAAVFVMFRLWGFINHANIRINLGPLTPVVSGPQWHRIHHSILADHYNKNFATFFPFIDIVFGTYHRPQRHEFPPTGLPAGETMSALREASVAPFQMWCRIGLARLRKRTAS
jgi:sterol desaturase/sphingolipid hydroxylase (fatty acid hydroxylase superfamily)